MSHIDEIKQTAQKDREAAFDLLVKRYHRIIAAYIYRMTRNYHETEDIVQEVFIKAYHEQRIFNQNFNTQAWLYRVAANTTFSATRKIKKIFSRYVPIDENIHAAEEAGFSRVENSFEDALDKLKPKYKEIIILRYIENLEYKEIAEVLECKIGTVMSRLSRAKEQMAVFIK